jgi:hypothetical protein
MVLESMMDITFDELEYLKSTGRFKDDLLASDIPLAVINQARANYAHMIGVTSRNPKYVVPADHLGDELGYPKGQEIFAYALENHVFSQEELARIDFDDARSPEGFIKRYSNSNLIESLRTNLLGEREQTPHYRFYA